VGIAVKPLLINALGRSGTTMTMRLLASHPGIVAHTQYPCELRLIGYACHPDNGYVRRGLLAYPFKGRDELLRAPFEAGTTIRPQDVKRIYHRIAAAEGKEPRYFIEKGMQVIDPARAHGLFAGFRTVTILRDPRDVLLSIRAFDASRGYPGFFEKPGMGDAESLAILRRQVETVLANMRKAPTYVLRYDEMIANPERALEVLRWLRLDASPGTVAQTIERSAVFDARRHRTSPSAAQSVGRWPREMSPELQALFRETLDDLLTEMGFDDPPRRNWLIRLASAGRRRPVPLRGPLRDRPRARSAGG
jgi:hypothetical protein